MSFNPDMIVFHYNLNYDLCKLISEYGYKIRISYDKMVVCFSEKVILSDLYIESQKKSDTLIGCNKSDP